MVRRNETPSDGDIRPVRGRNLRRVRRALMAAATVATVAAGTAAPRPAEAIFGPQVANWCAWGTQTSRTVGNVALPDTNATYWTTPLFTLLPFGTLELHGSFPAARYFSVNVYTLFGASYSVIADRDITPDPGSKNPFADPTASADPAQRRYTVRLVSQPDGSAPNQLAVPFLLGWATVRVYTPDDPAQPTGGVPLPQAVSTNPLFSTPTQTCPTAGANPLAASLISLAPLPAYQPPAEPKLVKPTVPAGLFPNLDNKYLAAQTAFQPGRMVVVHGRAPGFPDTRAGEKVPPARDVRYFSLCTNLYVGPYPVVDCRGDSDTAQDAQGRYTYVVSGWADKPSDAVLAQWHATWIPWFGTPADDAQPQPSVLLFRTMLPGNGFHQAVQDVPDAPADAATARTAMGEFYPEAWYCTPATFAAGGAGACAAATG